MPNALDTLSRLFASCTVHVYCTADGCRRHGGALDGEALVGRLGAAFPVAELFRRLRCHVCGAPGEVRLSARHVGGLSYGADAEHQGRRRPSHQRARPS